MNALFLVALGGALGSSLRYLISKILISFSYGKIFPLATFIINFSGSFLAGILYFFLVNSSNSAISENLRLFLMVGFFGGFTTFSTFSLDVFRLINAGQHLIALQYILFSLFAAIAGVFLGFYLARYF